MPAFATADDLSAYLPPGAEVAENDVDRLLLRASELVAEHVTSGYTVDTTGAPTVDWQIVALRDATCAQVEQWLEVGEENDTAGYRRGTSMSSAGLSISSLPSVLAPRARRILRSAGLMYAVSY